MKQNQINTSWWFYSIIFLYWKNSFQLKSSLRVKQDIWIECLSLVCSADIVSMIIHRKNVLVFCFISPVLFFEFIISCILWSWIIQCSFFFLGDISQTRRHSENGRRASITINFNKHFSLVRSVFSYLELAIGLAHKFWAFFCFF